jgi:flagellin
MATTGGVNSTVNIINRISNGINKTSRILSTGSNFPSASYGSASYSILQRLNSHTGATAQSIQNTQNASAMLKVAAGATSNTVSALNSIQQHLVKAANGVNSDSDRAAIQQNINQLVKQIDDNAHVQYNGMNLLDGSRSSIMVAGVSGYEKVSLGNMSAESLGLTDSKGNVTVDVSNYDSIQNSLATVSSALDNVRSVNDNLQSTLSESGVLDYALDQATDQGAYLQRLEYQADNYTTMEENAQAAASNIGDADMAKHSVQLRLQKIQQQVAIEVSKIFHHSQAGALRLLQ